MIPIPFLEHFATLEVELADIQELGFDEPGLDA